MELPKIVALGIYDSNIAKPNITISKNRKVTMFEIELPMKDGGISYIDSTSRNIDTSMLICAKPGQIRHTKFPFQCFYIHMVIKPGMLYDLFMKTPDFLEIDHYNKLKRIFSEMISHYNHFSEAEDIMVHSKVLELIYFISQSVTKQYGIKGAGNHTSVIERTIQYIDDHLTEDLSLERLADFNSLSTIHFHNVFKNATGKTLRNYVEEQRIKKAIHLLLTTNFTLTQIAYECGFTSQSYFSYAFKRKMQCSPRQYVKKINHQYEI